MESGSNQVQGDVLYRWTFGKAEFDEARWQLTVDGKPVELERKPLEVLRYLLAHAGEAVTKEELLESVWSGRIVVEAVLTNAVGKLRRALHDVGIETIVTLPRVGYRLDALVKRHATEFVPQASLLAAGDRVPRRNHWILDKPLARRSNGEVWAARHEKTGQLRVFKFSLDGRRLGSLKREVTVGRLLGKALGDRIQGLVPVIDWDFEQAPYFVEFDYAGTSLDQWRDGHGRGISTLPLEQRLALFIRAAETVAAAHEIGVLHKDIKPANLLVERNQDGLCLKVADFGSSRIFDDVKLNELGITELGLTQTQAFPTDSGTPLYLAPEVLAGQVPTVKSDIYALGVTLYQLAVGDFRRGLSAGWESDIGDPLLREDIAAAANGDPAKRPDSAAELAERVRNLRERHQKAALEEMVRERIAASEARSIQARIRRPWVVTAITVLVVGLVLSGAMWWRSEDQRRMAEHQARRAEAVVKFLSNDLIGAVSPGGSAFEKEPTIRDMLEYASAHVDERFPDDAATRGSLNAALGMSWRTMGDRARGERHLAEAVRDYTQTFGPADDLVLKTRYEWINTLSYEQKFDEAEKQLQRADALAGGRLTGINDVAFFSARAHALLNVQQVKIDPAASALQRAVALQRKLHPDDALLAAQLRINLADVTLRQGKSEEAIRQMRDILADPMFTTRRIGEHYVSALQLNLARALRNVGRYDEALPLARAAVEATERVLGPDQYQTLVQWSTVAGIYDLMGQCAKGLDIQRHVWRAMAEHVGATKQSTLAEAGNLADMEFECGDKDEGIARMSEAVRDLRQYYGGDANPHSQMFRFELAGMLTERHRYDEALVQLQGLSPAIMTESDSTAGWDVRLKALRGRILVLDGQVDQGRKLLAEAIPALITLGTEDPADIRELNRLMGDGQGDKLMQSSPTTRTASAMH